MKPSPFRESYFDSQEYLQANNINYLLTRIIHNINSSKNFDLNVFEFLQKGHFLALQGQIDTVNLDSAQVL